MQTTGHFFESFNEFSNDEQSRDGRNLSGFSRAHRQIPNTRPEAHCPSCRAREAAWAVCQCAGPIIRKCCKSKSLTTVVVIKRWHFPSTNFTSSSSIHISRWLIGQRRRRVFYGALLSSQVDFLLGCELWRFWGRCKARRRMTFGRSPKFRRWLWHRRRNGWGT
jgi:hypothetical protein